MPGVLNAEKQREEGMRNSMVDMEWPKTEWLESPTPITKHENALQVCLQPTPMEAVFSVIILSPQMTITCIKLT